MKLDGWRWSSPGYKGRHFTLGTSLTIGVAHLRRAEIEGAMRDHPHGIEQVATQKLHPDDSLRGVNRHIFLERQQVVGKPQLRVVAQRTGEFVGGVEQIHARAASALLWLEKSWPAVAPSRDGRIHVVERECSWMG